MDASEVRAEERRSPGPAAKAVLGGVSLLLLLWAFFATAGRFAWVDGWVYVGLLFAGHGGSAAWIWLKSPEVLRHRGRIGEGTPGWDKAVLAVFSLSYLGSVFVAAADAGRSGEVALPGWARPLGVALFVAALSVVAWSMISNPHFEKTARVQRDRDHRVIDSGPYRFVRHPGYLALIVGWVSAPPLLLGSARAFLPAALAALALIARTYLEDRLLQRELDGYRGYADRVRFRLLPGIW